MDSILGHPTNGWFANLANGGGNFFANLPLVGGFFKSAHKHMETSASQQMDEKNKATIDNALREGKTPHQALDAGSAAMSGYANPAVLSSKFPFISGDLPRLGMAGIQTAYQGTKGAVKEVLKPKPFDPTLLLMITGGIAAAAIVPSLLPDTGTARRKRSQA